MIVSVFGQHGVADVYKYQGHYNEAKKLYIQASEGQSRILGEDHPETLESRYALACLFAMTGARQEALDQLRQTVEHGWADELILDDQDLQSLRGDPEFEAIVAEVKKRIGEE